MKHLTLTDYIVWVRDGSISPVDQLNYYIDKAKSDPLNAWITITDDYALDHVDSLIDLPLAGAAIGIKDNINVRWTPMTCASQILSDYTSPYTAFSYLNLEQTWWVMIGKNNMDELAMGWSGQNSNYGPTLNPHDHSRITGGSSSGGAAAVAAGQCIAALGTDTWWSVRQPAAMCGIVWVKPTYGRVSRYGVQAMASGLDQVGTLTQTVDDAIILLQSISGYDPQDATSADRDDHLQWTISLPNPKELKICILEEFMSDWLDKQIRDRMDEVVARLIHQWYQINLVSMPLISSSLAIYYILCPAQVSTNMSRFDGLRFGLQHNTSDYPNLQAYYADVRSEWFGDEVIRRILTGTYVLSSWYYDAYYHKALLAQQALKSEFARIFADYDLIIWPTSPVPAWKIGDNMDDPVADYLADIYTVSVNIAWLPAISVPMWTASVDWSDLPVGLQLIANHWREDQLFAMGKVIEELKL